MIRGKERDRAKGASINYAQAVLSDIIPSTVFDLDATKSASYSGSGQTWANLVPAPADGQTQTAYDFILGSTSGSSTDDPTFNGSAGSSSAYWSNDAGDRFTLASGTNTAFLDSLHKSNSGQAFTFACAFMSNDQSATVILMGTTTNTTAAGIRMSMLSTETVSMSQNDGTTSNLLGTATATTIGNPTLAIISWNGSNTVRAWVNNRNKKEENDTFLTATGSASSAMVMFRSLVSGSRFYAASAYNTFIDDAEASKIINTYNVRHSRTYA